MKVSVVTPVLNAVDTISDCIRSVADQSYGSMEHIVVDGGSTDGTLAVVRKMGVRYVSEKDVGVYDAFNRGVSLAVGDVVHILNADDMYAETNVVELVVCEIAKNQLDICHGYTEQIDASGVVVKKIGRPVNKFGLLAKMRVVSGTFISKRVYEDFGDYSIGFKIAADHEFLLRVWDKVRVGFIPLVVTRMRLGGVSNSNVSLSQRESAAAAIIHGANPVRAIGRYYLEVFKSLIPGVQPRV